MTLMLKLMMVVDITAVHTTGFQVLQIGITCYLLGTLIVTVGHNHILRYCRH